MNSPKDPLVYIIILNWNGLSDTLECLSSLKNIEYKNHKILIVDNGSDIDKTALAKIPEIETIFLLNNLGFSGGNNIGIQYALNTNAEYILLLNNDTIVEPNFLNELVNAFKGNNNIGFVVPKINFYSNRNLIWYAGGYISKLRSSGYPRGEGRPDICFNDPKYVSFATGCCLLIKSEVIRKIGLMDENYFLYLEDSDYCMRALQQGFKIKYYPKSKIYHKVNISTTKINSLLPFYYTTRNRLYFAKKFNSKYFPIVGPVFFAIFLGKLLIWSITGDKKRVSVFFLAVKHFFQKKMGQVNI